MPKKKPPARRKRSAPQGAESHARKQERLEARRRAKEAALIAAQRRERRARAIRTATFVTVFLALIYFFFFRETSPDEIAGNPISSFSTSNGGQQTHAAPYDYTEDTTGVNPPVSGRHDPVPAECGTHSEKVADENLVHTLEHGAVAVLYDPKEVPLADIKKIETIVSGYADTTISAPYPGLSDHVVVASWSRKMPLDSFDDDAITEYIDTFRDTEPAPEFNGDDPCETTSDDVFEPEEETTPSPSPSPEASPEDKPKDDKGSNTKSGSGGGVEAGGDDDPSGDDGTADKGSGDNSKMDKEQKGN